MPKRDCLCNNLVTKASISSKIRRQCLQDMVNIHILNKRVAYYPGESLIYLLSRHHIAPIAAWSSEGSGSHNEPGRLHWRDTFLRGCLCLCVCVPFLSYPGAWTLVADWVFSRLFMVVLAQLTNVFVHSILLHTISLPNPSRSTETISSMESKLSYVLMNRRKSHGLLDVAW
jgi:hypothetical protein